MQHLRPALIGILAAIGTHAAAQPVSVSYDEPTLDRWMYPFNFTAGTRASALTFTTGLPEGFDDRDAQFLVGFDTGGDITTGLAAGSYQVTSAVVTVVIETGDLFVLDNTQDPLGSYYEETDVDFVLDADAGRPAELFGVGYRNGYDLATWEETTVFGGAPAVDPAQGARHAFSAAFDIAGTATDVSNNIKDRVEVSPMALGDAPALSAGDLVPVDTIFEFVIDLSDPAAVAYIQRGLAHGRLNFAVTSLHPSQGGSGGGSGDQTYPIYYTKDNVLAQLFALAPKLDLEVTIGNPADLTGDGIVDAGDLGLFIASYLAGDLLVDFTGDGIVDAGDLGLFISLYIDATG